MAKAIMVQLVNKNNLVIDEYVSESGTKPTVAVKDAMSKNCWLIEVGDSINVKEVEIDEAWVTVGDNTKPFYANEWFGVINLEDERIKK